MDESVRIDARAVLILALLIGCAHDDKSRQQPTIVAPSQVSSGDISQRPKTFQTTSAEEVAGNGADERLFRDQKAKDKYPAAKPRLESSKDMYRRLWREQASAREQHDENRQQREAAETKSKSEESRPRKSRTDESARTKEKKRADDDNHRERRNPFDEAMPAN